MSNREKLFDPKIIFQRSQAGRDEIYEKKCGLTQSERLVLIMIDGVSAYHEVRNKVPVLTDERFSRALKTLQKKDLVLEVFLPVEGLPPEEVDKTVIDRFLQQDPADPLTIISFDPDEEFALENGAPGQVPVPIPVITPAREAPRRNASLTTPPRESLSKSGRAMDESLIQQAELLAEEVRARRSRQMEQQQAREMKPSSRSGRTPKSDEGKKLPQLEQLHWGHWMIGVGLAFIIGFVVARLTG